MDKELSSEEIDDQFKKVNNLLKKRSADLQKYPELKSSLEEYETVLAVAAMKDWLPRGIGRRLIMLVILIVGISGAMAGNKNWLFILLLLPLFSPRVVMRMAIILGYLFGNHKK